MWTRRALRCVAVGAAASALVPSGSATAATITPIRPGGPATLGAPVTPFADRVLTGSPRASAARSPLARAAATRRYRAAEGISIEVAQSSSFPDTAANRAAAQSIAGFLGTRTHGSELRLLRVFIGTGPEINSLCGGGQSVLACYERGSRRMYIPDRDPGRGQYTRDYAITHELGHHIAGERRNDPFSAINFGAKYWSSHEHVCDHVDDGELFPGNQGSHYYEDPGEGFADAYAHLHYPGVGWQYAPILRPDAAALAAVRRDVVAPWRGSRRRVFTGSLDAARTFRTFAFPVALDGTLDFRLSGPRNANFNIRILNNGRIFDRSRAAGSRDRLRATYCRTEGLSVGRAGMSVARANGAGRFTLTVFYPG